MYYKHLNNKIKSIYLVNNLFILLFLSLFIGYNNIDRTIYSSFINSFFFYNPIYSIIIYNPIYSIIILLSYYSIIILL